MFVFGSPRLCTLLDTGLQHFLQQSYADGVERRLPEVTHPAFVGAESTSQPTTREHTSLLCNHLGIHSNFSVRHSASLPAISYGL